MKNNRSYLPPYLQLPSLCQWLPVLHLLPRSLSWAPDDQLPARYINLDTPEAPHVLCIQNTIFFPSSSLIFNFLRRWMASPSTKFPANCRLWPIPLHNGSHSNAQACWFYLLNIPQITALHYPCLSQCRPLIFLTSISAQGFWITLLPVFCP